MTLQVLKKRSRAMSAPRRAQKVMSREAAGTLTRVSAAAGASWEDIKRTVDSVLADGRATAAAAAERFSSALSG